MDLRRDDRAQAIQVGAVLLFAMLVIAMSVYQAQVVPSENAEIEFNSYLESSSDMTELRNDMLGVASTNTKRGTTVTTGTGYPTRVFFVNPAPATGRIRTGEPENLSLSNVQSTGDHQNVDTYFQSESSELEYTTRHVEFAPSYSEIDVAPVIIANGFTYRNYSRPIPLTTQTIIQGNRLNFVTVEGDLDAGGITTALTTNPVSASTRTVSVTNRTSNPLVITIPTPIPASTWETEIIAGQMDPSGTNPDRYVTSVDSGPRPNSVNVTLEPGATYELRIGRIELHEKSDVSDTESPDARYLTTVTDTNTQTSREGRVELVVEARDEYNNPVSNSNVTFNQSDSKGTFETKGGKNVTFPVKTDDDGRATVYYNATGHLGDIPVDAWLGTSNPTADEKDVRFSVFNNVLGGDGGGGSGEQAGRNLVILEGYGAVSGSLTQSSRRIRFEINNTGSFPTNITGYRLDFATGILSNGGLVEGPTAIESVDFDTSEGRSGLAYEGRSPYFFGENPIVMSPDSHTLDVTFNYQFNRDSSGKTNNNIQGVFIGMAVYLEGDLTVTFQVHVILK